MGKLDDLIAELCPDGVEYKPLDEIVDLTMGTSPSGDTISEDSVGGIEFHQGKSFFGNMLLQHSNTYTTSPIKMASAGSIIMSVRAPVGDSNITGREISIGRGLCAMNGKNGLDTKFLYYHIKANIQEFKKRANGSTFEAINTNDIKSIPISVPPLPVQQEIVRILDKFTALEAELEAELEARKKQYEYYRDELLAFDYDVHMGTLGTVATNLDSKRKPVTKGNREAGEYPYYGASGIVDYVSNYIFDGDYLLVSEDGANLVARVTPIAFSASGKIWVNNHAHVLKFETYVERKFVEYYLNMIDLSRFISTAAQPKLAQDNLNKIPIPVPSFKEQERIVTILDRFDALVNDITQGLPAEIEARHKQYEYYRDKLLTFKEKVS